ncbi:MAG: FAD-dependent oxidoreductase [Caldilineaceae bacterium]
MKTAIVGGGIMGISLAYFLTKQGVEVEIFEASPTLGGLAGPIHLDDGVDVDRYYHAILPAIPSYSICATNSVSAISCATKSAHGLLLQG